MPGCKAYERVSTRIGSLRLLGSAIIPPNVLGERALWRRQLYSVYGIREDGKDNQPRGECLRKVDLGKAGRGDVL